MSVQGKNSLSYKKKNTDNQNQPHTGFKTLVFGHQFASAGETIIPFDGLVQPSDWAQAGLVNPIAPTLLAAQLQVFKKNITVTSSARGIIQKSEYTVHSNRIEFLNIESLVNEAFEVEVADFMITGNLIVDQQTIRVQGEMNDGETDFNMGYEFDIFNEEIIVFRDGIQMFRSDNNDSSGATGNYYYLDNGNGRGSVLRFFEAAVGVEPILVVTTGGVVDPANVSTFQQIEHLAGQIDAMVPTLAALAGVPETDFQAAPNQVDLKAFGDLLLEADKRSQENLAKITAMENWPIFNGIATSILGLPNSTNVQVAYDLAQSFAPSNMWNFTLQRIDIPENGWYDITMSAEFGSVGSTIIHTIRNQVIKNGVDVVLQKTQVEDNDSGGSYTTSCITSGTIPLNAGDNLTFFVFQNTGATMNLNQNAGTQLSIKKVRDL